MPEIINREDGQVTDPSDRREPNELERVPASTEDADVKGARFPEKPA